MSATILTFFYLGYIMSINLRTDTKSEEEIEEEGKDFENNYLKYKKDVEVLTKIRKGQFYRANIKKNIHLFNKNEFPKISELMLELAGEEETFSIIINENVLLAKGFGYTWRFMWLENFIYLGEGAS
jgi:hypothetical protein